MHADWRHVGQTPTRILAEGESVPEGFIVSNVKLIDGLATPIVEVDVFASTTNRTWRITSTSSFEPVPGLDPNFAPNDNVAKDPSSGRILALHHISGLYVYDEKSETFRHLSFQGQHVGALYAVRAVPRLGMTLVSTQQGLYRLDGERLIPLESASQVGPISDIWDLPIHHGVALNQAFNGKSPTTLFRSDDGQVRLLTQNSRSERINNAVFESPLPGQVLLKGSNDISDIKMGLTTLGWLPESSSHLRNSEAAAFPGYLVTKAGVTLVLSRPGRLWGTYGLERLDASGLHAVAGETVDAPARPVPMIEMQGGAVLIQGTDRWYRYLDGSVMAIAGSDVRAIGPSSRAIALSSIGKTLIVANDALFTVTPDAHLERLSLPLEIINQPAMWIMDFPAAGLGLVSVPGHLYMIDKTGSIHLVVNLEGQIAGRIYARGELSNKKALLIVNGGIYQILRYSDSQGECEFSKND